MLDAQPVPGETTASWINKYGYTLEGCKAGPWKNSVFSGKTVYVHVLDWSEEGIKLPAIPRKLVSSESITGDIRVTRDETGWRLTGTPDPLNTIVKLEFDASVEDIACALPSEGSHTAGKERAVQSDAAGSLTATVDLEEEKLIDRFEFTIANPGYRRGKGKPFEFQVQEANGAWKTVYDGRVYGTICGKKIVPVSTKAIRLIVKAEEIIQLDVF
jgi:hypothetical protein